jgi:hypothetical protein
MSTENEVIEVPLQAGYGADSITVLEGWKR